MLLGFKRSLTLSLMILGTMGYVSAFGNEMPTVYKDAFDAAIAKELQLLDKKINKIDQFIASKNFSDEAMHFSISALTRMAYLQELAPEDYGDLFHKVNVMLGHRSLSANKTENAKDYLASACSLGGKRLSIYGPDLTLAKRLLNLNEKASVIQYLQKCGKYWRSPNVDLWIAQIQVNILPF